MALVLWSCVSSFCPLSRLVFGVLSLNMVLFRVFRAFLARFGVVVWVCVGCVLCVACVGFCAREELGGLKDCSVFASVFRFFSVFVPLLSFCPSLVWLPFVVLFLALFVLVSLGVFVSCCGCVVGFSFSLSDYTQKERARRVGASSLVLLWVALSGCCFVFLVLVRCQPVYIVIKFQKKVI